MRPKTAWKTKILVAGIKDDINTLIGLAEVDADRAEECDAPDTAKDDRQRAGRLRRVLKLIADCER